MPQTYTENSGGAALDTIQPIASATSTTANAWGSTITCDFSATGQTLTLPAISATDIGKTITVQNAGINAFGLAIASGMITSPVGLSISPANTFIVKATSTTTAIVISPTVAQNVAAESGEAYFTTANAAIAANSIIMSFTLPSAGVWDVEAQVATNYNALTNGHIYFRNSANTEVPYSRAYLQGGTQGSMSIITTIRAKITTTGVETCQLFTDVAIAAVYGYNVPAPAQGGTKVRWNKSSGAIGVSSVAGATAGDVKLSSLATTHGGNWVPLFGQLKSSLTAEQQAVATSLGYGANLPDWRGRMAIGAGGTLNAVVGATGGSLSIAQNQLPNLSFTPTISSAFNLYNGSGTPSWDTAPLSGITNFALTQSTPELVNQNLQGVGILSISSSAIQLNGGVTQQSFVNPYFAQNWFIWLGSSTNTLTLASPMVGANGTIAGSAGTVPAPAATANTKFLKGDATYGDAIGKIATAAGVSAMTAGTVTALYTVPTGRSLNATFLTFRVNTATGTVTTNPAFSIGSNAATYDNLMATTPTIGCVTAGRAYNNPVFGAVPIFTAGSVISIQVDTAQAGATALTYDVELYGVLS